MVSLVLLRTPSTDFEMIFFLVPHISTFSNQSVWKLPRICRRNMYGFNERQKFLCIMGNTIKLSEVTGVQEKRTFRVQVYFVLFFSIHHHVGK